MLKNIKGKPAIAVPFENVSAFSPEEIRLRVARDELKPFQPDEALLLLRKDLLDQQIIDVNGRKVVRVNDLSFSEQVVNGHTELLLSEVDIGLSGAVRRLLHGALPRAWLRKLESHVKGTAIRWEFVDLLEADPLRQVKLNISHKVLKRLHPADLADIMEELAPRLRRLPVPVVVDHMGYMNVAHGMDHPGFEALLDLVRDGVSWIKLSGNYRISAESPPYADAVPFARALIEAAKDHMIWGTDWPHPALNDFMPNDGDLLDALDDYAPEPDLKRAILVDNPARLYGFES